nr:hypothetical protein [Tanacetum cinerariifolium]
MRQGSFVDCVDQGALYVHAKINFQLLEFLGLEWDLITQHATIFYTVTGPNITLCGLPNRIGPTISRGLSFVILFSWATRTKEIGDEEVESIHPDFSLNNQFTKRGLPDLSNILTEPSDEVKNTVRVFSSKGSAISKMRDTVIFEDNRSSRPSKVLLVEALLWKIFLGIDEANTGHKKTSLVSQPVNLRNKLVPKLPDNTYGNIVTIANAWLEPSDQVNNMDLQGFLSFYMT